MMKKVPLRQCVGCREMKSKKELVRILKTTEDELMIDATGKKNGRGAYICRSMECLEKAQKSKGLERSLKMPVPQDVYETLRKELAELGTEQ
ncbi:RNase P modulator RnpM [Cuneatibacter caecimuris]